MSVPSFGDFGKAVKDLLSKNFYKAPGGYEVTSKRVTNQLTLESNVNVASGADGSAVAGSSLKSTYKCCGYELEVDANVNGKAKATVKADKAVDNLVLKASANSAETDEDVLKAFRTAGNKGTYEKKAFATVQADYSVPKTALASVTVNSNGNGAFVDASLASGKDGLVVGGAVKLAVSKTDALSDDDTPLLLDYSAGVQYNTPQYTLGLNALSKGNKYALNYFQSVSKDYSLGTSVECDVPSKTSFLTFGSSYKPSADVLLKAKAKVGKDKTKTDVFTVTALAERSFANPAIKVGATAEFNVLKSVRQPTWYGVSLALGDF